jgi:hypothetical protein
MELLIAIFRMTEISVQTRIRIIKQLGPAINHQFGMNITEGLVYELVLALDPNDSIKNNEHYLSFVSKTGGGE